VSQKQFLDTLFLISIFFEVSGCCLYCWFEWGR